MSQYFRTCTIQTNFSDTKNVLTKKHQSNVQNYEDCLRISKNLNITHKTPEEIASIIDKMRKRKIECQNKKPIQVIHSIPEKPVYATKICQAFTLSGKKCAFKAVCGCYCKKHKIDDNDVLGTKPKINISLL